MLVLLLVATGLAACGSNDDSTGSPEVQGPALVMFYTDN